MANLETVNPLSDLPLQAFILLIKFVYELVNEATLLISPGIVWHELLREVAKFALATNKHRLL